MFKAACILGRKDVYDKILPIFGRNRSYLTVLAEFLGEVLENQ